MDAFSVFTAELEKKLKAENLPTRNLSVNFLSNGIANFTYDGFQIGRIYFGKRTSKMQIIDSESVIWLENEPLENYIANIDKWIKYIIDVREEFLKNNETLKNLGIEI